MNLYIIGNGFDLNHNLKTSYNDYKNYLKGKDSSLIKEFETFDYFIHSDEVSLWRDIEKNLTFDYFEYAGNIISEYYPNMNNDSDSRWDDIRNHTKIILDFINNFTVNYFQEWIAIENSKELSCKFNLDKSSKFLTFNYTRTLENIYKIDSSKILHLHGEINNTKNKIQFGSIHNNSKKCKNDLYKAYENDDFFGASIESAVKNITEFSLLSSKNIESNYNKLIEFLKECEIDQIIIMGHSIGITDYDFGYYSDIIVPRIKKTTKWIIYVFDEDYKVEALKFIEYFEIKNYEFISW